MRFARPAVSAFVVVGLTLIGLHLGPLVARAADLTDLQAGLIVGSVITWTAFRIDSMLYRAELAPTNQQA